MSFVEVPVDPDAAEAREWLLDELRKTPYQSAKPSLIDQIGQWLLDTFADLIDFLTGAGDGVGVPTAPLWVAIVVPIAIVAAIAFLVYGVPRLNRRSSVTGALFGEHDERDAMQLRKVAERAAAAGDYTLAVTELFRALARGLAERTLVTTFPGTTAGDFARRAGTVFPDDAADLATAATDFDAVRYLDHPGTRAQWDRLVPLERRLRTARPALEPAATTEVGQ